MMRGGGSRIVASRGFEKAAKEQQKRENAADEERLDFMRKLFLDKNSPVAFAPATTVYRYLQKNKKEADERGFDLTLKELRDFELRHVRENQILRRPGITKFPRLPYFAWGLNDQWQLDLIDYGKSAKIFILTKIDVFSRRADASVLRNKSAPSVLRGFKEIVARNGRPNSVQTDEGKEFLNETFREYCRENRIYPFKINSNLKAAMVERFNRTLQTYLQKMRLRFPKMLLKDAVKTTVDNYNARPHTALKGRAPISIDVDNHGTLLSERVAEKRRAAVRAASVKKPFKYKIGDYVRTTRAKTAFSKEREGNYTEEVFVVRRVFNKPHRKDINLYELKDLTGEVIAGIYYEQELLRLPDYDPTVKKVRNVLQRRQKGTLKKRVNFLDHPITHSQWVP